LILATVENAARDAGFWRYEMGSTLTGVPLYRLKGYVEVERIAVPLHNGEALPVVKMVEGRGIIRCPAEITVDMFVSGCEPLRTLPSSFHSNSRKRSE